MKNLLARSLSRFGLFLGVAAAVMGGFQFVLCAVVSTIDVPALLAELVKSLPPLMRDLIVQYVGGFGPADLLAFGWNHPIALAVGGAAAIVLAARAVAGEVEAGTLELVLSQPVSRFGYIASQSLFGLAGIAVVGLAGALGTWLGQRVYGPEALGPRALALIAANFFLLQAAWFGLTMVLSVFGREAGRVGLAGFLLALLSYLAQVIGEIWPRAAFVLPYSPNHSYDPRVIVRTGAIPSRSILLLGGLAVLTLAIASWRFLKRDIP